MKSRALGIGVVVIASALTSGCAREILARNLVEAPNRRGPTAIDSVLNKFGVKSGQITGPVYAQSWKTAGTETGVDVAVAVIEPGDYEFRSSFTAKAPDAKDPQGGINLELHFDKRKTPLPCKGTVVALHGFGESKESMIFWGLTLAQHGYRAALVDLRGHGDSGGRRVHFGSTESDDLIKVVDDLQRRKLAGDQVGLLGVSYGGAVGILWAAKDARVQALVLIEPYADPRRTIPEFIRGASEKMAKRFSDADFAWAEERGAKLAGFSWSNAVPLEHVGSVKRPILFFHGERDTWVSPSNSEDLKSRAAAGSKLVKVPTPMPQGQHVFLPLQVDLMGPDVVEWFDTHLAAELERTASNH